MKFHLLYTTKDKKFHNEVRCFDSFPEAEIWLVIIEAVNWEIGIPDDYIKLIQTNENNRAN